MNSAAINRSLGATERDPRHVMVLHSDALLCRRQWEEFWNIADKPAAVIARRLLRTMAKDDDDATGIVVRSVVP